MISEIVMPDLGATGGDALLESWLVEPGEPVRAGQPIVVVITDKATVEVEAFRDGVLREIRVVAGETVPLGAVMAIVSDTMDEPVDDSGPVGADLPASTRPQPPPPAVAAAPEAQPGRRRASPIARRLALQAGIDLERLTGSGRQGQVLRRDVEHAIAARSRPQPLPETVGDREPLSPMRRAIAARTVQSKAEIPHFYAGLTIDMAAAEAFRREVAGRAEAHGWVKPTVTDVCLRAAALALSDFPLLNASLIDNTIAYHEEINIGLVVGLEGGMIIPVLRAVDRMNLYTLAAESKRLRAAAEAGRLRTAELSGGTFTLSNLGMLGLDWFAAIINPPEVGILAMGAVNDRPAVVDGELTSRKQMDATLSVDHRLVDGVVAARFLATFKELLEHPLDLILGTPQEQSL